MAYLEARAIDYYKFLTELTETPTVEGVKDLGYCRILLEGLAVIDASGVKSVFDSIQKLHAYVLRQWW